MSVLTSPFQGDAALRQLMRTALQDAGKVALSHFGHATRRFKPDGTEICDADLESQSTILDALQNAFPNAQLISEEGQLLEPSPHGDVWFIDPIDGTSAFLEGLAHWGPTITLVRNGKLVAGALWLPLMNEFWYAERGAGAWLNDQRIISTVPVPSKTLYLPSYFHHKQPIPWPGRVRALGSSAVHLALVSHGRGAATIIPRWQLWDVGCGLLLNEEAGRVVTTLDGSTLDPLKSSGKTILVGSSDAISKLQQWRLIQ